MRKPGFKFQRRKLREVVGEVRPSCGGLWASVSSSVRGAQSLAHSPAEERSPLLLGQPCQPLHPPPSTAGGLPASGLTSVSAAFSQHVSHPLGGPRGSLSTCGPSRVENGFFLQHPARSCKGEPLDCLGGGCPSSQQRPLDLRDDTSGPGTSGEVWEERGPEIGLRCSLSRPSLARRACEDADRQRRGTLPPSLQRDICA